MKKVRNSWWNRIFHREKVDANVRTKVLLIQLIKRAPLILQDIGDVTYTVGDYDSARISGATSLLEVLAIHKKAWSQWFRNKNIGPNSCAMYRCESIAEMNPSQVFLGAIWGLFTHNIEFWERCKNEGKTGGDYPIYGYLTVYQIVLQQYKHQLSSNIRAIAKNFETELDSLEALGY